MGVNIRPMRAGEVEAVKRLILGIAARLLEPDLPEAAFVARVGHELKDVDNYRDQYVPPDGIFLVAEDGGRLIGSAALRRLDGDSAELRRMWLLETYHGLGIGFRLWQETATFARRAGYRWVWLTTEPGSTRAIRFYTRLGFRTIPNYRRTGTGIFMELDLTREEMQ